MILPRVSGAAKTDFILSMLSIMVKQGSVGMSEEDLKSFKKKLKGIINKAKFGEDVAGSDVDIKEGAG